MEKGCDNTHVVLLEEVLAEPSGHEHPACLRMRTEVCLAALTPRGRLVRVELHCARAKRLQITRRGGRARTHVEVSATEKVVTRKHANEGLGWWTAGANFDTTERT